MIELTKEDVIRLLADPSPQARADIAAKVGRHLSENGLDAKELQLAQDIIRAMAQDIAVQVRLALSINVKRAKNLPHDVAMRLARDVEQVALPVLEFSTLLSDEDLLEIVGAHSPEKQEAIARRETVSEKVASAIVDDGNERVVGALLGNKGARIDDKAIEKAAVKFGDSPTVQEKLVMRERLPLAVSEKLVGKVSDALKEYLVTHHDVPGAIISDMVMQSREQATMGLLGGDKRAHDIERLVVQLRKNGRLTPSLIIRGLCVGDVAFFEASMAALANAQITNARVLIHDSGKLGLKSLYDRTGLPQGIFPVVRVALDVVKEMQLDGGAHDRARYQARVIERILTQYEDFNSEDLSYLLDRLGDLVDKAA